MTAPLFSVVIPAYNAAATIGEQLEALVCQESAPAFEVVVADNRSNDRTADAAMEYADRLNIRVVRAFERQGVNYARNTGIEASRGDIIVLLDADDRAQAEVLKAFSEAFARDPGLGIAGGLLSSHDQESFEMERPQGYLPYVPGGIMALRRAVYDSIGGFDEEFVGGHDEVDFCWRAQHAGFRIDLVREAVLDRTERQTLRGAFHQFRGYGSTYVQLWVKHRERGIAGSSPRGSCRCFGRCSGTLRASCAVASRLGSTPCGR